MQLQAKHVVLGLLRQQPMTGYEIKKKFEGEFSFFFDASYGSIYPTLAKLEKEGTIVKMSIAQTGRPNKHPYAITEAGQAEFAAYLNSPTVADSIRSDLCTRLYFGAFADRDEVGRWLDEDIRRHEAALAELTEMHEKYGNKMTGAQKLSLEIGISHHQSRLDILWKGKNQLGEMEE